MDTLSSRYGKYIGEMIKKSVMDGYTVTADHVYQKANRRLIHPVDHILLDWLDPSSELRHFEHAAHLAALAREGKACLIFAEHYSNFDFPQIHYLLRQHGEEGRKAAKALVAIAGVKLHEGSAGTSAFLEAFTRIVVYPAQSVEALRAKPQTPEVQAELARSVAINRAAMKHIGESKLRGEIPLIFPTGTRYRPGKPHTKKGLREIDTYLKMSDAFLLMSINGNCLRVNESDDMLEDTLHRDRVVLDCSPVMSPAEFRAPILAGLAPEADRKQAVVDAMMDRLNAMHEAVERDRL